MLDAGQTGHKAFKLSYGKNFWKEIGADIDINAISSISDTLYVAGCRKKQRECGVFISNDEGESWENIGLKDQYNIIALYSYANVLFVATWNNGIFITQNNGRSWYNIGLKDKLIKTMLFINGVLYVGTLGDGVFRREVRF